MASGVAVQHAWNGLLYARVSFVNSSSCKIWLVHAHMVSNRSWKVLSSSSSSRYKCEKSIWIKTYNFLWNKNEWIWQLWMMQITTEQSCHRILQRTATYRQTWEASWLHPLTQTQSIPSKGIFHIRNLISQKKEPGASFTSPFCT